MAQDGLGLVVVAQGRRRDDDHAAEAAEGWAEIKRRLAAETHDLYVLDEFTYPINWGWVDVDDVVETLAHGPATSTSSSPAAAPTRSCSRSPTWSPR